MGLCYPKTYEEHYLRVFVKDERKYDAARFAFDRLSLQFSDRFKEEVDAAVIGSPTKDRQYASQR